MSEKYTALGKTELKVVKLGLGAAPFASLCYGDVTVEECKATLNKAIEQGVTYIDTAPWYGQGRYIYLYSTYWLLMTEKCNIFDA